MAMRRKCDGSMSGGSDAPTRKKGRENAALDNERRRNST